MNMAEVIMNPVRQRIIQYLMVHDKGTVKEIKNKLSDIPTPSLYRHVKILVENSVIVVAEENRIRGTVESVYRMNPSALTVEDEDGMAVQVSLMSICTAFAKYFATGHADPRKDMLMLTSCTLMLTDDEFGDFLKEINEFAMKYFSKEPTEGRSPRHVTLISSPVNE